jgi:hypothetical protein
MLVSSNKTDLSTKKKISIFVAIALERKSNAGERVGRGENTSGLVRTGK